MSHLHVQVFTNWHFAGMQFDFSEHINLRNAFARTNLYVTYAVFDKLRSVFNKFEYFDS